MSETSSDTGETNSRDVSGEPTPEDTPRRETVEADSLEDSARTMKGSPGGNAATDRTPDPAAATAGAESDEELLSDRYRIGECLGEGTMGRVYRATHVLMDKTVAIKVLRRELSEDDEIVARFRREARAAASLNHPNICQATDFGRRDDGAFFLVMEHLDGHTLEQLLEAEGPLAPSRSLEFIRQIASALEHAHDEGIVHRDLTPDNIMVLDGRRGEESIKIMDFGIARLLSVGGADEQGEESEQSRLTKQGEVFGTPHYMSPEQVRGEDVDGRTDVYALGAIAFEMLTGSTPFEGATASKTMALHVDEPVPKLEQRCSERDFAEPLQEFVGRLLAKSPDERPAGGQRVVELAEETEERLDDTESGEALAEALAERGESAAGKIAEAGSRVREAVAARAPDSTDELREAVADQTASLERRWRGLPGSHRRLVGMATAALFCVLLVLTAVAGYFAFVAGPAEEGLEAEREQLLEDEAVDEAMAAAEDGDRDELEELLEQREDDPHLHYLALKTDLAADHSVDVVERADTIIELEDDYARDRWLVGSVADEMPGGDEADEFLADHLNPVVREVLSQRANTGDSWGMRNAAYAFLDDHDQWEELEEWQRLTAELWQTDGCSDRADQLDRLGEIGDPGALATIEEFQALPKEGCGRRGNEDCIGCIRDDLEAVAQELGE